MLLLFLAVC